MRIKPNTHNFMDMDTEKNYLAEGQYIKGKFWRLGEQKETGEYELLMLSNFKTAKKPKNAK